MISMLLYSMIEEIAVLGFLLASICRRGLPEIGFVTDFSDY